MLNGKIVGIKKNHHDSTVTHVSVLLSVEDAIQAQKNGELKLSTEVGGVQKNVIVKHTGRAEDKEYFTTAGDDSGANDVEGQPEV